MSRTLEKLAHTARHGTCAEQSAARSSGIASASAAGHRWARAQWRVQCPRPLVRALLAFAVVLAITAAAGADGEALPPPREPAADPHVDKAVAELASGLKASAGDPAAFPRPLDQNDAQPLRNALLAHRMLDADAGDASGQAENRYSGNGSGDAAIARGTTAHMGNEANSSSSLSSLAAASHGSDGAYTNPEQADRLEHSAGNIHSADVAPAGQVAGVGLPAALENQPAAPAGNIGVAGRDDQRLVAPLAAEKQPDGFHQPGGGAVGSDRAPAVPAPAGNGEAGMIPAPGAGATATGRGAEAGGASDAADDDALVCESGDCLDLGTRLIDIIEGEECRSLLVTGRCPRACFTALQGVVQHSRWAACATRCRKDVVEGAADRWLELCDLHVESLLDKGKDVVKKIVSGDGLPRLRVWSVAELLAGLVVLIFAVAVGYRRGASAAHRSQRLRMRHARKNSHERVVQTGNTLSGVV